MTHLTTFTVTLPQKFNISQITEVALFRADKKKNITATICYILNSLIQFEYRKDSTDEFNNRGYFSLSSDIMIAICGNRYKLALELLESHRVIESDKNNKYSVGRYSKGYRLIGDYAGGGIKFRELNDSDVKLRLIAYNQVRLNKNKKSLESIDHITKWLIPERLSINKDLAHYYLELYYNYLTTNIPERLPKGFTLNEINNRITQRYNSANIIVRKINEGEFSLSNTGNDRRLHTTVTSLKKELRTLITFDNEQLVSLDLTASQPYLFTQLFNPKIYDKTNNGWSIRELYPELDKVISKPQIRSLIRSIIMSTALTETPSIIELQQTSFKKINWSEDFYEFLNSTESRITGTTNMVFRTRNGSKKTIMNILYNKKGYKHRTEAFIKFEQLFPSESALIKVFDKLDGDNYLPILLQRMESFLMLNVVGKAISEQVPDAPLITVHDCFLTTPKYVVQVNQVMKSTFLTCLGIEPGIKIEPYSKQNTISELEQTALDDLAEILKSKPVGDKNVKINLRYPISDQIPEYEDALYLFKPLIKRINKMKREAKLEAKNLTV
jgi:hypothetical protein